MQSPELSISVGELLDIPRVKLSGVMEYWHDQAVQGVLAGFRDQGVSSLVLDIAGLNLSGADGASGLINVLRSLGPNICIHTLASGATMQVLRKAGLSPKIRLYTTTDEISEYLLSGEEYLTSRWMADDTEHTEIPMVA